MCACYVPKLGIWNRERVCRNGDRLDPVEWDSNGQLMIVQEAVTETGIGAENAAVIERGV